MTLPMLSSLYRDRSVEKRVWELVAFLGRYAHQPANVSLGLTLRQMAMLADSTSKILKEEHAPPNER